MLKTCVGAAECTAPWTVLHPDGRVRSLHDALAARFDAFYAAQERVVFTRCERGYIRESEGPDGVRPWVGAGAGTAAGAGAGAGAMELEVDVGALWREVDGAGDEEEDEEDRARTEL